jgi:hypothetical protein
MDHPDSDRRLYWARAALTLRAGLMEFGFVARPFQSLISRNHQDIDD